MMVYADLLEARISEELRRTGSLEAANDLLSCAIRAKGKDEALSCADEVIRACVAGMRGDDDAEAWHSLWDRAMLLEAPLDFPAYMMCLESNREPRARFWLPRRGRLGVVADALQSLDDGRIGELFVSLPPRVGKTTIGMLFITWVMGKDPEASNLYVSFSDAITRSFYEGVMEILRDQRTYRWHEIFPERRVAAKNAALEWVDIDRRRRYHSLTCRSIDGTLNGACDCSGYLLADDLISGFEEAISEERLEKKNAMITNDMLSRAKESAKVIWIGTRWSVRDAIGRRLESLDSIGGRDHKVIAIPALDERGESNFDYDYGVGFSTESYVRKRDDFESRGDEASWDALYMCSPIERNGSVFSPESIRTYSELPPGEPLRVYAYCDPAFGGGDYVSCPIGAEYSKGGDVYVIGWVFSNLDRTVTQPEVIHAVRSSGVVLLKGEYNSGGEAYMEDVKRGLRALGCGCEVASAFSERYGGAVRGQGKATRILDYAPEIKARMLFRETASRPREYGLAMQGLYSWTPFGKSHDDAPDSLAGLMGMFCEDERRVIVFDRPF